MSSSTGTPGIHGKVFMNGIDITDQIQTIGYDQRFSAHPVMVQNVGVHTSRAGAHQPGFSLDGFRKSATSATTGFDLTRGQGATAATDTAWVVTCDLGFRASPVDGDRSLLLYGTLVSGPASDLKPDDLYKLPLKFEGRGNYTSPGNLVYTYTGTATTTSAFFDSNPNAYTLPTLGGICMAQIVTAFSTDTMIVTVTSATTSGGSYSTFGTFAATGSAVGGEWLEIASGTTINRYIKVTVTKTGTSDTPSMRFYFARRWI